MRDLTSWFVPQYWLIFCSCRTKQPHFVHGVQQFTVRRFKAIDFRNGTGHNDTHGIGHIVFFQSIGNGLFHYLACTFNDTFTLVVFFLDSVFLPSWRHLCIHSNPIICISLRLQNQYTNIRFRQCTFFFLINYLPTAGQTFLEVLAASSGMT